MIEFFSYDEFPDDPYCKELVYLTIDGKYKVAYVAKFGKTGNKFWDVMSSGTMLKGQKTYHKAFEYDSNFQKEEALKLLASKPWEKKASVFNHPNVHTPGGSSGTVVQYQQSQNIQYPPQNMQYPLSSSAPKDHEYVDNDLPF